MKVNQKLTLDFAVVLLLGLISICYGQDTEKDKPAINFGLSVDYFGKYIWRGQNYSDDHVFQSMVSVSHKNLTAMIWGNIDLTNINGNSGDFSELDYCLDYSSEISGIKGVSYSLGIGYFDFPGTESKDTTEVYFGLSLDMPLNPSITFNYDLDEVEGTYILLATSHSLPEIAKLAPDIPIGMKIGASLGWGSGSYNKYYWGTDQSKLNDLAFSVSFPMEIAGWTAAPNLNYVMLVSDDIRATDTYGTDSDFFFVGISVSKSF